MNFVFPDDFSTQRASQHMQCCVCIMDVAGVQDVSFHIETLPREVPLDQRHFSHQQNGVVILLQFLPSVGANSRITVLCNHWKVGFLQCCRCGSNVILNDNTNVVSTVQICRFTIVHVAIHVMQNCSHLKLRNHISATSSSNLRV